MHAPEPVNYCMQDKIARIVIEQKEGMKLTLYGGKPYLILNGSRIPELLLLENYSRHDNVWSLRGSAGGGGGVFENTSWNERIFASAFLHEIPEEMCSAMNCANNPVVEYACIICGTRYCSFPCLSTHEDCYD